MGNCCVPGNEEEPTKDTRTRVAEYPNATLIKVTNIPHGTATPDDVKQLVAGCGNVLETSGLSHIYRQPDSDQYVLVTMETPEQAQNAVNLTQPQLNNHNVTIELVAEDGGGYIPKEMNYISQKVEIAKYGYWVSEPIHK